VTRTDPSDRPPICPACGVTMVPAELSAADARRLGDWVCLECELTQSSADAGDDSGAI
jgi:hypothetical protein